MNEKTPTDWEAIEREYRAGQLSVSEIGRIFGVSHTAINKRAKKFEWPRDLVDRVRQAVSAKLVSNPVSDEALAETVDQAATRIVQVVREHKTNIRSSRNILGKLFDELNDAIDHREEIEDDIVAETVDDKDGQRRARMLRAVALGSRAGVMLSLSAAMKNVIVLERQAFNISTEGDKDGPATTIEVVNYGDQGPTAA